MNNKKKLLAAAAALALSMLPSSLLANDGETEEGKVCVYRENCQGELIYVCVEEGEAAPAQLVCPPECWEEE